MGNGASCCVEYLLKEITVYKATAETPYHTAMDAGSAEADKCAAGTVLRGWLHKCGPEGKREEWVFDLGKQKYLQAGKLEKQNQPNAVAEAFAKFEKPKQHAVAEEVIKTKTTEGNPSTKVIRQNAGKCVKEKMEAMVKGIDGEKNFKNAEKEWACLFEHIGMAILASSSLGKAHSDYATWAKQVHQKQLIKQRGKPVSAAKSADEEAAPEPADEAHKSMITEFEKGVREAYSLYDDDDSHALEEAEAKPFFCVVVGEKVSFDIHVNNNLGDLYMAEILHMCTNEDPSKGPLFEICRWEDESKKVFTIQGDNSVKFHNPHALKMYKTESKKKENRQAKYAEKKKEQLDGYLAAKDSKDIEAMNTLETTDDGKDAVPSLGREELIRGITPHANKYADFYKILGFHDPVGGYDLEPGSP